MLAPAVKAQCMLRCMHHESMPCAAGDATCKDAPSHCSALQRKPAQAGQAGPAQAPTSSAISWMRASWNLTNLEPLVFIIGSRLYFLAPVTLSLLPLCSGMKLRPYTCRRGGQRDGSVLGKRICVRTGCAWSAVGQSVSQSVRRAAPYLLEDLPVGVLVDV
jgi:hypothetical protein